MAAAAASPFPALEWAGPSFLTVRVLRSWSISGVQTGDFSWKTLTQRVRRRAAPRSLCSSGGDLRSGSLRCVLGGVCLCPALDFALSRVASFRRERAARLVALAEVSSSAGLALLRPLFCAAGVWKRRRVLPLERTSASSFGESTARRRRLASARLGVEGGLPPSERRLRCAVGGGEGGVGGRRSLLAAPRGEARRACWGDVCWLLLGRPLC